MGPLVLPLVEAGLNMIGDVATETTARNAYKHRYQDEVKDLRAAGLNPALAYGANPGNPNTATFDDIGSGAAGGAMTAAQVAQARANADNTKAQTNLLQAQTADLIKNVQLKNNLIQADIVNRDTNTAVQRTQGQQAQVNLNRSKETFQADVSSARTAAHLLNLEVPERAAGAAFSRGIGKYRPYLNSALDIIRALRGTSMQFGPMGGAGTLPGLMGNTPP